MSSHQARNPNNINIKLNFNSEIINNNIKVGKSENLTALNQIKSSLKDYVSPKNVKEKNTNQDTTKKVNYYLSSLAKTIPKHLAIILMLLLKKIN